MGVDGSCQWLNARGDFQEWRDGHKAEGYAEQSTNEKSLAIFWIHANPGTGKSVLASHVASQLQDFKLECASHFFHVGDKKSRSLGVLLRSIAYQMALTNATVRDSLFKLFEEGSTFDLDDSRTIWTKLFKKCILLVRLRILLPRTSLPHFGILADIPTLSSGQALHTAILDHRRH